MTSSLVVFLRDRYDETERIARAVPVGSINVPPAHWSLSDWRPDRGRVVMGTADDFTLPSVGHAVHITLHDPAGVLLDLEAKRAVLAVHKPDGKDGPCVGCGLDAGFGESYWAVASLNECPTLRALALAFRDHPDYDEAWRPQEA